MKRIIIDVAESHDSALFVGAVGTVLGQTNIATIAVDLNKTNYIKIHYGGSIETGWKE